jgi:hypothetical protein
MKCIEVCRVRHCQCDPRSSEISSQGNVATAPALKLGPHGSQTMGGKVAFHFVLSNKF